MYIEVILCTIIVILFVYIIDLLHKYHSLEKEYYNIKHKSIVNRTKLSMLESIYRRFSEGENPYTVLRDISNILKEDDE